MAESTQVAPFGVNGLVSVRISAAPSSGAGGPASARSGCGRRM